MNKISPIFTTQMNVVKMGYLVKLGTNLIYSSNLSSKRCAAAQNYESKVCLWLKLLFNMWTISPWDSSNAIKSVHLYFMYILYTFSISQCHSLFSLLSLCLYVLMSDIAYVSMSLCPHEHVHMSAKAYAPMSDINLCSYVRHRTKGT